MNKYSLRSFNKNLYFCNPGFEDAKTRITDALYSGTDGLLIANNIAGLMSGNLVNPIIKDEFGNAQNVNPRTGANADDTKTAERVITGEIIFGLIAVKLAIILKIMQGVQIMRTINV